MNDLTAGGLKEQIKQNEMRQEVCDLARAMVARGGCPLEVVQALIHGTITFAGRIGETAMRDYVSQCDDFDYSANRSRLKAEGSEKPFASCSRRGESDGERPF